MGGSEVTVTLNAGSAWLTIDREAARNTLSANVITGLLQALEQAETDAQVRSVVITGAGARVFSGGGDLSGMSGDGFLAGHEARRLFGVLLLKLQNLRKPTVARINGHALAGGLGLVLACDLAVASSDAALATPEISRGLFPMMVTALLQRHLGRKRALELLLTGERITADKALSWGLVNRVVPAAELDAATNELASMLNAKSQAVMSLGRRAYFTAEDLPVMQALEYLNSQLSLNLLTEDAAEGVTAFLEKREPQWADR